MRLLCEGTFPERIHPQVRSLAQKAYLIEKTGWSLPVIYDAPGDAVAELLSFWSAVDEWQKDQVPDG